MKRGLKILLAFSILISMLSSVALAYPYDDCYYYCDRDGCYYPCYDDYYYHRNFYPVVRSAYWDNRIARWDSNTYADEFEVALYRNREKVTTVTTSATSYNFDGFLLKTACEYYFRVRPYNRGYGFGEWVTSNTILLSNYSHYYIPSQIPKNGPPVYDEPHASTSSNQKTITGSTNVVAANPQIVYDNDAAPIGFFVYPNTETYFSYTNGVFARNTWIFTRNNWYYFDTTAKMVRGLYTLNGTTYYFNQDGSMATGVVVINGVTHYFDALGSMVY